MNNVADHFDENILCTVKVFKDGLVEVSPSLSAIIEEQDDDLRADMMHQNPVAISAFMTDNTVEKGEKQGQIVLYVLVIPND